MKNKHRSYRWLSGTAAGLTVFAGGTDALHAASLPRLSDPAPKVFSPGEFAFHHEGVLGTSLELIVHAGNWENARFCETVVLAEIERLRQIFSTRDSASEINRVQAGAAIESPELAQLLDVYGFWGEQTGGAISVNMAGVLRLWEEAQITQCLPDAAAMAKVFAAPFSLNVDALGKGLIVDRAVEAARRFASAGLLNIGGDLRAWGNYPWLAGVANPRNPAENAPLTGRFALRDAAVATSGGYARFYTIAGKRFSHIVDPRTFQALDCFASATVVAADCLTANALSTAACVLGKVEGENLVRRFGAAGYLLTDQAQPDARGGLLRIAAGGNPPETTTPPAATSSKTWPKDFQVSIHLEIKTPPEGRGKRPYVVVWVEDAGGKFICTVAVWGTRDKYISELSEWYEAAGGDKEFDRYKAISRATRPAGKYTIAWDGLDDQGNAVPKGTYTVCVELNREEGHHGKETVVLPCLDEAKSVNLPATAESEASTIEYGPKPK